MGFLPETGFTYFARMGSSGPIKIGRSKNPQLRLGDLNASSPFELIPILLVNGARHEKAFHRYFKRERLKSEWFDCNPFVMAHVRSLLGGVVDHMQIGKYHVPIVVAPSHVIAPTAAPSIWTAEDQAQCDDYYDEGAVYKSDQSGAGKYLSKSGKRVF